MKAGKVPENVLKRSVLRQVNGISKRGEGGAGIGKDCAAFLFAQEGKLVSCVQEAVVLAGGLTGSETTQAQHGEAFMTLADLIQKCANNLAAGGARLRAVMLTLLLPEDSEESVLRGLTEEAAGKCRELGLEIAGGQSRVSGAVVSPVAVVTGYGVPIEGSDDRASELPEKAPVGGLEHAFENGVSELPGAFASGPGHTLAKGVSELPGKASADDREHAGRKAVPGQDIVLSKWIGLQGTAVLAKRSREKLSGRYPAYLVEEAAGFGRYLSVLPEAETAVKNGVRAMHDASEGGILGALWEFAEGSGVGLDVDMRSLPLRQETVEVCECCNVNPYELMSGGCLIMACRDGRELAAALKAEGIPATVVGKVTAGRERILHNGEEIRYMNRQARDGIYM